MYYYPSESSEAATILVGRPILAAAGFQPAFEVGQTLVCARRRETIMDHLDNEWVTVAILGRARGIRGELTAISLSKPERYSDLREVFLFPDGARQEVESAWFHDNRLILKFRGVDTMSDAERLTGCEVRVPRAQRLRLDPGEYFESDLIGCEVVERDSGASLGRVTAFNDGGTSGVLEVEGCLLIPFVRAICVAIQPEARRIVVDLPAGLKELNQA